MEGTSSQALNELGRVLNLYDIFCLRDNHLKLRSEQQKLAVEQNQAERCLLDGLRQWKRAATAAEAEQKALEQKVKAAVHAGKACEIPQLYQKLQKARELAKKHSALFKTVMTELTELCQQSVLYNEVTEEHANDGHTFDTATEDSLPDLKGLLNSFRKAAQCSAEVVQELDRVGEQIADAVEALKAAADLGRVALDQIQELESRIKEKVLFTCFLIYFCIVKKSALWLPLAFR